MPPEPELPEPEPFVLFVPFDWFVPFVRIFPSLLFVFVFLPFADSVFIFNSSPCCMPVAPLESLIVLGVVLLFMLVLLPLLSVAASVPPVEPEVVEPLPVVESPLVLALPAALFMFELFVLFMLLSGHLLLPAPVRLLLSAPMILLPALPERGRDVSAPQLLLPVVVFVEPDVVPELFMELLSVEVAVFPLEPEVLPDAF